LSFNEIREYIYGLVKGDATFQSLTGGNGGDNPRIYYQFPPESIPVSDTYPAFVVYLTEFFDAIEAADHVTGKRPPITFTFVIWSQSATVLDQIFERLFDIPFEVINFNTATYGIKLFRYLEGGDFPVEREFPRLHHRVVRWKAEVVYERS
jgi:hypothetical protein|tara:strand:+ start:4251 stop:4703 length:453 start_codon:yes stop_codon:yes gene_type:complete